MDKDTSDKLNDTLGKMGAMGAEEKAKKSAPPPVSDSRFYMVMLALIVGMGFYISYDIDQRYGDSLTFYGNSDRGVAADVAPDAPIIVNIEKIKTVEVVPLVTIPATDKEPEAVVVEKVVKKTTVTTAIVPVSEAPEETAQAAVSDAQPVAEDSAKTEPVKKETATQATESAPVVPVAIAIEKVTVVKAVEPEPVAEPEPEPAAETAPESAESTPVSTPAEPVAPAASTDMVEATDTAPTPVTTPQPGYNPYAAPYYNNPYQGQYQAPYQGGNYYQPQPYGNPDYNQYNQNPYGYGYPGGYPNPYGNPYGPGQ